MANNQTHGNCRYIPLDLEAKAHHYKNGIGSHSSQHKEPKLELKVNFNDKTQLLSQAQIPQSRGGQPFAIAGRITFISMKYSRQ